MYKNKHLYYQLYITIKQKKEYSSRIQKYKISLLQDGNIRWQKNSNYN